VKIRVAQRKYLRKFGRRGGILLKRVFKMGKIFEDGFQKGKLFQGFCGIKDYLVARGEGEGVAVERMHGCGEDAWLWRGCVAVERMCGCGEDVWLWRGCVAVEKMCGCGEDAWLWRRCVAVWWWNFYIRGFLRSQRLLAP
jgi:hypothetical protein